MDDASLVLDVQVTNRLGPRWLRAHLSTACRAPAVDEAMEATLDALLQASSIITVASFVEGMRGVFSVEGLSSSGVTTS